MSRLKSTGKFKGGLPEAAHKHESSGAGGTGRMHAEAYDPATRPQYAGSLSPPAPGRKGEAHVIEVKHPEGHWLRAGASKTREAAEARAAAFRAGSDRLGKPREARVRSAGNAPSYDPATRPQYAGAPAASQVGPFKQPALGGEVIHHPAGVPVRAKDQKAEHHGQLAGYHEKMAEYSRQMGRHQDAAGHAAIAVKNRAAELKKAGKQQLQTGPSGGQFYISASGEKVYVK